MYPSPKKTLVAIMFDQMERYGVLLDDYNVQDAINDSFNCQYYFNWNVF